MSEYLPHGELKWLNQKQIDEIDVIKNSSNR